MDNFVSLLLDNSFLSVLNVMVHLECYFPHLFVNLVGYIDAFLQLQLTDKVHIYLESNFIINIEIKNVLHLNMFSHIKLRYKYPTYSMSQMILKQQAGHIFHTCTLHNVLYYMYYILRYGNQKRQGQKL